MKIKRYINNRSRQAPVTFKHLYFPAEIQNVKCKVRMEGRNSMNRALIECLPLSGSRVPGVRHLSYAIPPIIYNTNIRLFLISDDATMAEGFLLGPLSASCAEQTFYRKKHFCCPSGHLSPNGRKGGTGGQQNKWNFQFFVFGKFHSLVIFYSIHLQPLS